MKIKLTYFITLSIDKTRFMILIKVIIIRIIMRRRININKNNNENKYFNEKKPENKN